MVTRRALISLLGATALTAPFGTLAQSPNRVWRIGFLGATSASGYVKEVDAIRERFRTLGYVEGRNLVIEYRWAEGNPDRLKDLAAEFVALKVDAIITHALLGTRAAADATKSIPIVIADATDPVAAGLVASHSKPGGNITGSTSFQPENSAKRLELLKEVRPRLKRAAVLLNARAANNDVYLREMEPAAKRMDLDLLQFTFRGTEELAGAFAAMAESRIEATVIGEDPVLNTQAGAVAALALAHRLPTSGFTNFADAGGLLGYGSNRVLVYARAADFVDKILKGANPGDLPIERASRFELIVNLKTARVLDIRIPPQLLQRADRVIDVQV